MASKCLIIGSETLSRVTDLNDRDSMIYADGAGAVILESKDSHSGGILSHSSATYTSEGENEFLFYGVGNKISNEKFLKMNGRKVNEFALKNVPFGDLPAKWVRNEIKVLKQLDHPNIVKFIHSI